MDADRNVYRVKTRMFFGAQNQYGPGDIVELTAEEAAGFLDKLELVAEAGTPVPAPSLRNDLGMQIPDELKLSGKSEPEPEMQESESFKIQSPSEDEESTATAKPKVKRKS